MKSQRRTFSPEKMKDKTGMGQALAYTAEGDEPGRIFRQKKKSKKDMGTGYEKTPSSFFPKYLYSILRWGSWQRNRRSLYARSVPWATTAISLPMKMATGPSRAELRTSLQAEAKAAAATHKVEFTNRNKLAGNSPRMGSMLLTDKDLSIRNFVICDR